MALIRVRPRIKVIGNLHNHFSIEAKHKEDKADIEDVVEAK